MNNINFVYFGLIGDEATDVSTYEQVSVCVMFVECTDGILKSFFVRIFLVLCYRCISCRVVLTSLENFGIVIENMRAQGYDGAANMSGIHRGVQARIRGRIPTAQYVHSKTHVLNLAIVHSSSDVSVKTMMATV